MTPEERASEIVRTWLTGCHLSERRLSDICEDITDAIYKAVAEERERCARVASDSAPVEFRPIRGWCCGSSGCRRCAEHVKIIGDHVADAIRKGE